MKTVPQSDEQLRQEVSARYARTALQVLGVSSESSASCCGPIQVAETQPATVAQTSSSCCESSCCTPDANRGNPITSDLYTQMELGEIPEIPFISTVLGRPLAFLFFLLPRRRRAKKKLTK